MEKSLNQDVGLSHAFPPAVLTASGLKGMISAEWHPQAIRKSLMVPYLTKPTQNYKIAVKPTSIYFRPRKSVMYSRRIPKHNF